MRLLILLTILPALAICSCNSSKKISAASYSAAQIEASESKSSISSEEVLTIINSSADMDFADITLEFFPSDTLQSTNAARPCRLTIGSVKVKNEANAAIQVSSEAVASDSVSVNTEHFAEHRQSSAAETKISHPLGGFPLCSLLAAVGIFLILRFVYRICKNRE